MSHTEDPGSPEEPKLGPLGGPQFSRAQQPTNHWPVFFVVLGGIVLVVVLVMVFPSLFVTETPLAGRPARLSMLKAGDCFDWTVQPKTNADDLEARHEGDSSAVAMQPCTSPHDAEMFGIAALPLDDGLPGDDTLPDAAREACRKLLRSTDLRDAPERTGVQMVYPGFPGRYERKVACVFAIDGGKLTRPVRPEV